MEMHGRTVIGILAFLGLFASACGAGPPSPDGASGSAISTAASPGQTTTTPPNDDWASVFTVGPPGPDIPRFTVNGVEQTIKDWFAKLESGDCQSLVSDTRTYSANSDNSRATYALSLLYRGVAYACLSQWRAAAIDLERATICKDDLDSIGNSDHVQPFTLLDWAVDYVQDHGEQVGGGNPVVLCAAATSTTTQTTTTSTTTTSGPSGSTGPTGIGESGAEAATP